MTHHYPDPCRASDCLNQISHAARPIGSTSKIWVVMLHQYRISVFISQTSFGGETSGSVTKCWLFSQAIISFAFSLLLLLSSLRVSECSYWTANGVWH